ncbi:MAG: HlyD family efflux transporter periplasmic adaptor subunit [Sulfuricurvum sp.]|uniref:HlyD family secretion protein n=1 Tax=Sulfuricurvum sp. TaxID=2025608 RepID=UPI00261925F5|nr:HlyD family efflux transporter periplasmic adaptor subunit [Sulfuricurvum sp.]MDD2369902.1 HlyD family efflux transporter periplasmic adaptor subunit [Sulfuricurvum sp.]MDD5118234.1 HlyD family efflux transporter periplasmic adaptor subunit [Sulfuricurvum sp.]
MIKIALSFLFTLLILTGCKKDEPISYQGYVEGEYVNIASSQSGRLDKLFVTRGENVKADAPLFVLDSENETDQLRQNEAQLTSAQSVLNDMQKGSRPEELDVIKAKLTQAKADADNFQEQLRRNQELYKANALSKEALDNTIASAHRSAALVNELQNSLKVAQIGDRSDRIKAQKANIQQIQALISQTTWKLSEKARKAPSKAMVFDTLYREGEFVPTGGIVVRLLPPQNRKIRFFVPQNISEKLAIGQKLLIVSRSDEHKIPAHVTYISTEAEYTPPIIYSNETKDKLIYMIEAYPSPEDAPLLHPGQPVEVTLEHL